MRSCRRNRSFDSLPPTVVTAPLYRARMARRRWQPDPGWRPSSAEIEELWDIVAATGATVQHPAGAKLSALDPLQVAPAAQRVLLRLASIAWGNGWQPTELHRELARRTNRTGSKLAAGVIVNDHLTRDPRTLDPRWVRQVETLMETHTGDPDWIVRAAQSRAGVDLGLLVELVAILGRLQPIPALIPPPGMSPRDAVIDLTTPFDSPMLERVRALLAKAESTEFEAEAEAFTAKAHELMARHSIDHAMLAARAANSDVPVTIRLPIDNPYADAKVMLCQIVAEHCGARTVFQPAYAFSTVIGFAGDVAATELLFTSLLVQAQTALQGASRGSPESSRRGFRSSFLAAYAHRIGERLEAINAHVVAEAEHEAGYSLVPVLASRDAAVRAAVDAAFSNLTFKRSRGARDPAGWSSGRLAADRANLNRADLAGPGSAPRPARGRIG